jgi:hypothetical protein
MGGGSSPSKQQQGHSHLHRCNSSSVSLTQSLEVGPWQLRCVRAALHHHQHHHPHHHHIMNHTHHGDMRLVREDIHVQRPCCLGSAGRNEHATGPMYPSCWLHPMFTLQQFCDNPCTTHAVTRAAAMLLNMLLCANLAGVLAAAAARPDVDPQCCCGAVQSCLQDYGGTASSTLPAAAAHNHYQLCCMAACSAQNACTCSSR